MTRLKTSSWSDQDYIHKSQKSSSGPNKRARQTQTLAEHLQSRYRSLLSNTTTDFLEANIDSPGTLLGKKKNPSSEGNAERSTNGSNIRAHNRPVAANAMMTLRPGPDDSLPNCQTLRSQPGGVSLVENASTASPTTKKLQSDPSMVLAQSSAFRLTQQSVTPAENRKTPAFQVPKPQTSSHGCSCGLADHPSSQQAGMQPLQIKDVGETKLSQSKVVHYPLSRTKRKEPSLHKAVRFTDSQGAPAGAVFVQDWIRFSMLHPINRIASSTSEDIMDLLAVFRVYEVMIPQIATMSPSLLVEIFKAVVKLIRDLYYDQSVVKKPPPCDHHMVNHKNNQLILNYLATSSLRLLEICWTTKISTNTRGDSSVEDRHRTHLFLILQSALRDFLVPLQISTIPKTYHTVSVRLNRRKYELGRFVRELSRKPTLSGAVAANKYRMQQPRQYFLHPTAKLTMRLAVYKMFLSK
jgi:hypothetical protein